MGPPSTILDRCIWCTLAFDFVPGQQFHTETHESEFLCGQIFFVVLMAVAHDYFACDCDSKHTKQIHNRFHVLCFFTHNDNKSTLKITHVWRNEMQRTIEDHRAHDELRGCFYRGRVRTDDRSAVAVSLCDGMVSV